MRICIDIDGTICHLRQPNENYSELKPIKGAVNKIKALKDKGHYIILATARHMKTCEGNEGKVIAKQGLTLLTWLKDYGFLYDEIWFGKPYAEIYIDDKGFKFEGCWDQIDEKILLEYSQI